METLLNRELAFAKVMYKYINIYLYNPYLNKLI